MRGSRLTRVATALFLLAFVVGAHPLADPKSAISAAEFIRTAAVVPPSDCAGCDMTDMHGGPCQAVCAQASAIEPPVVAEAIVSSVSMLPSDEMVPLGRAVPPILAPPRIF
jgi:hypothetical protein